MTRSRVIALHLTLSCIAANMFAQTPTVPTTAKSVIRQIPHATTGSGRLTSIDVDEGDQVTFRIVDTDPKCFTYNVTETQTTRTLATVARTQPTMTGNLDLQPVTHSDGIKEYAIKVRPVASCDADSYSRDWIIPVRLGWKTGAGAAYTFGTSTERHFFLKPETRDAKAGFVIAEDKVDAADQQMTAFVQVLHERWPSWNMLAVGTSVAADRPQTFIGTGWRFGNYAGLIGGVTFGKRNRLPIGMAVGDFLEQTTTLGTLNENTVGVFLGVQLSVFPGAKTEKPKETAVPKE